MKLSLTLIVFLAFALIWFCVGYWAIEKNKSRWAFYLYVLVCGTIGYALGTIIPAIWQESYLFQEIG